MRRILSFILALVLIMSSAAAMAAPEKQLDSYLDNFQEMDILEAEKIDLVETHGDEDGNVRVVVQLKDKPAISMLQRNVKKYAELGEQEKANLERNVLNGQTSVQSELSRQGISMDIIDNVTVAANAFSAIVKVSDIEKIQANPKVKGVFISNEYNRPEAPQMATSHDMIGSYYAWDNREYKGENMVVAIIDTGIDPSHKDMNLSEGIKTKITKALVEKSQLPGTYRTNKVPYGYNYFDKNQDILDVTTRSHGMHVAGTVGANGQIKGVAPEAQLLAMKVFSKDPDFPSTYDDIYMKAIDDAIKLGVDVINMSLGSSASFYTPNSAMDEIITNAREHGVIFSISAGNSGHSTSGFTNYSGFPFIENPDIGMVGAPSLNKDSISVASIENTHSQVNYIAYGNNGKAHYSLAGSIALAGRYDGNLEFVDVGLGKPTDYDGKDLNGKVALISRGEIDFVSKIMNAQNAGAAVAIVYNNAGNELINMQYPADGKIPAAFIGNTYGVELKALENKVMSFPAEMMSVPNLNAWKMAGSTSWGTTPTLEMKPEITAPGGQIFSTLEADTYGTMSGTSMAAPHLSGGAALVLQYLKDKYPNMTVDEISEFSKKLLMNTATPVMDPYGYFYSPRRQGAGIMNLQGALTTPVTVVNKADGEAKVQLKDFDEKVFNINLLATNHSNKAVTYDIEVDVLANWIHPQGVNFLDVEPLVGAKVTGDTNISLGAGEIKEISLTVDITEGKIPGINTSIQPNMFVEGFVRLVAPTDEAVDGVVEELYPSLVVPYVGFYGDWFGETSPRILDGMARFSQKSYFGNAGMVNQNGTYMGFVPVLAYTNSIDRLAISPNSTASTASTTITPVLSFMRNAEEVQFNVLDGAGNLIRRIRTENWVRKQYTNTQGTWYSYTNNRAWDGKVNNRVVEDGQYFYEIKAKPQSGQFQTYRYPVYVDTVAPEILNLKYEKGELSWEASDKGIGVAYFTLYVANQKVEDIVANTSGKYVLATEIPEKTDVKLVAQDYAGNMTEAEIKSSFGQKPTMTFTTPGPFGSYTKNSINITGSVKAEEGLKSLIAYLIPDGEEDDKIEVNITVDKDGNFNEVVKDLVDAVYTIRLVATDNANQQYEIFRYFHVDATAPVIKDIKVEVEDTDGEAIDKKMPGGGVAVIIPHLNEAFHKDYIGRNSIARNKFNQAIASGKDVYVKLADNVFVNYNGEPVTQANVPAVTYYNAQGLTEKYDQNGKYIAITVKTAKFTIEVEENHGYFEVYVNGSQEYIQSEYGITERIPFNNTIEFSIEIINGVDEFEVIIEDNAGNQTTRNISIEAK